MHAAKLCNSHDSRTVATFCVLISSLSLFINTPLVAVSFTSGSGGAADPQSVEVTSSRAYALANVFATRAQISAQAQTRVKHLPAHLVAPTPERVGNRFTTLWGCSPIEPDVRSSAFFSRPPGRAPPRLA